MVNVPLELAPHLHKIFFDDLETLRKEDKDNKAWNADYLMIMANSYLLKDGASDQDLGKTKNAAKGGNEIYWCKAEDDLYMKNCEMSFNFVLPSSAEGEEQPMITGDVEMTRHVGIIKTSKARAIMPQIASLLE